MSHEKKGGQRPLAERINEMRGQLHRMTSEVIESKDPIPPEVENALTHAALVLGSAERTLLGKPPARMTAHVELGEPPAT